MEQHFSRRQVLKVGGYSVTAAALLAACGGKSAAVRVPQAGLAPEAATAPDQIIDDVTIMRTATSFELSLAAVMTTIIDGGQLSDAHKSLVTLLRDHHKAHAVYFAGVTKDVGGVAYDKPNTAFDTNIIAKVMAEVAASKDQAGDSLRLVHALENVASATYQAFVTYLTSPAARREIMVIGSTDARHAAAVASALGAKLVFDPAVKEEPSKEVTVPVYVVPGAFANQGLTPALINAKKVDIDIPGPNSFIYPEAKTA